MNSRALATEGLDRRPRTLKVGLDVTVLMGGPSSERDVSLLSGGAIADALASVGHCVSRADISPQDASALDRRGIDVVFIALHGDFGESGQVQRLCEQHHLRYTGSPPRASEMAMDKAVAKELFAGAGLTVAKSLVATAADKPRTLAKALDRLGLPVVLKPVDGGSSVDITIARTAAIRDAAVAALLGKYGRAMAEEFVPGREFTVGILGDQALPVLEIVPAREFYDYTAKYADGAGTRYVFDHGLPDQTVRSLQSAALAAHQVLGCRDMSRVDFILPPSGVPVVLEINTIPGFTSHSLLPMAAAKAGVNFAELVSRIAMMAMQR
ncbi:MAG: D-alanine--D-alanine ligase [Phycisphaerae bacterium]